VESHPPSGRRWIQVLTWAAPVRDSAGRFGRSGGGTRAATLAFLTTDELFPSIIVIYDPPYLSRGPDQTATSSTPCRPSTAQRTLDPRRHSASCTGSGAWIHHDGTIDALARWQESLLRVQRMMR
jgi:hypothetical protein